MIDPHLLAYLSGTVGNLTKRRWSFFAFLVFAIIGMSGPTINQMPKSHWQASAPIAILLELSPEMLAMDISPSRLKRAKFKIMDLMERNPEREVALLAFGGDAHVVVPFTQDHNTIKNLLPALDEKTMPVKGVRLTDAINRAAELFKNRGLANIVAITSGKVDDSERDLAAAINRIDGQVILWRFGTPQKNAVAFSLDNSDIEQITRNLKMPSAAGFGSRKYDDWYDLGPYFVLIALFFFLLSYFSGGIFLALCFMVPIKSHAGVLDWFLRRDQQGYEALAKKEFEKAASLYQDDFSKGTAYLEAKNYEKAAEHLKKTNNASGKYNLGNALAHLGQVDEAIKAYDDALKLDPNHEKAKFNKDLLEKQKDKKSEQPEQSNSSESKSQSEKSRETSPQEKNTGSKEEEKKPQEENTNKSSEQDEKEAKKPKAGEPNDKKEGDQLDSASKYYLDQVKSGNANFFRRKFQVETKRRKEGGGAN